MANFIYDKKNYNLPINLNYVTGVLAPDTPSKNGGYYILFYTIDKKNHFWVYPTKEDRDFVYVNYLLPLFTFLGEDNNG